LEKEFLHIIDQHQGIIHKVCRIYRNTAEDKEDLFQEIVYQLWKAYPSFNGTAKITTWMYKVALYTAIAKFRNAGLKRVFEDFSEMEISDHTKAIRESEEKERLYKAINLLNPVEKAVVMLYLEGYTYLEMSAVLGISENYAGVMVNRVKQKIKKLLTF
jgi:RNA polymerase sigma-70 factor (ECF subfamily)